MKKSEKILITISTISLLVFILILLSVIFKSPLTTLDLKLNSAMPGIQVPSLISISKIIGTIIDPEPMIIFGLLLSILLWFVYSRKESIFLFLSMLVSGTAILVLKETIRITRPENSLIANSFLSFPSGHTTIGIVLLGIFCYWMFKRKKSRISKYITLIIAILILLMVSFSRLYLNAHWFSDIIAGYALGAFILTTSLFIKIKYFK